MALVTAVNGNTITYDEAGVRANSRSNSEGVFIGHVWPDGYTDTPSGYIYLAGTPEISVNFSTWENSNFTYIRETEASIGQEITVSDGSLGKNGIVLYDVNGNKLASAENPSYTQARVFFEIGANKECNYTLKKGTTYKYKFYAVDGNGKTHWSKEYSFKTIGSATHKIDLNWKLDGVDMTDSQGFATADVYINGSCVASGVTNYCETWPEGTSYKFVVKAISGYEKVSIVSGKESGVLGISDAITTYSFETLYRLRIAGEWEVTQNNWKIQKSIAGYGSYDVYVNDSLIGKGLTECWTDYMYRGSDKYSIKNIIPAFGKDYRGTVLYSVFEGQFKDIDGIPQLTFTNLPEEVGAGTKTTKWNGHTYIFVPNKFTWYAADYLSKKNGGHIVTFNSKEEEIYVTQLVNNVDIWLGATNSDNNGNWQWINNEPFTYQNWDGPRANVYSLDYSSMSDEKKYSYYMTDLGKYIVTELGEKNYLQTDNKNGKWTNNTGCTLNAFVIEIDPTVEVTSNPVDTCVNTGETAYFNVDATGDSLKYLWQYKYAGESTWTDWTTKTTASIGIAYNANKNGMSVRCVVTDVNGNKATSNAVVLTYK